MTEKSASRQRLLIARMARGLLLAVSANFFWSTVVQPLHIASIPSYIQGPSFYILQLHFFGLSHPCLGHSSVPLPHCNVKVFRSLKVKCQISNVKHSDVRMSDVSMSNCQISDVKMSNVGCLNVRRMSKCQMSDVNINVKRSEVKMLNVQM